MVHSPESLPPDFIERGKAAWDLYQQTHDVSRLRGQVAAVEPGSGRVWIAEEALEAIDQMNAEGVDAPVFLIRVGYDYLDVKGRR